MEEDFGGPVWHASGRGRTLSDSRAICRQGLLRVGDTDAGEWEFNGDGPGIVHVIRRLSAQERSRYGVPDPIDIRGTTEEQRRINVVYDEAPYLMGRMP